MSRQPGGDNRWEEILSHRPADQRAAVAQRFVECGVSPNDVAAALADLGDALCQAATHPDRDWAKPFGGEVAVALLAAEVSALAARLNSRASAIRARAVDTLLDEYSAVAVAARLGVSRQKVYEIAQADVDIGCFDRPGGEA